MSNNYYSEQNMGNTPKEKSKGGMKNDDGRMSGSQDKLMFKDKPVDSMPNEGAPTLGKHPVSGELI